MNSLSKVPFSLLLGGALVVWGVSCVLVHGPAIIGYVSLQILTSGVFAWQIFRVEQQVARKGTIAGTVSDDDSTSQAA